MEEKEAKRAIETLKPMQEAGEKFPCPRCGHARMNRDMDKNSLSRYADVYVCDQCGTDEAMRDMEGNPLPLTEWSFLGPFLRE